jgi:hypothetical protein
MTVLYCIHQSMDYLIYRHQSICVIQNLVAFIGPSADTNFLAVFLGWAHGRMNYIDTKPYMSAFLSVDLLCIFSANGVAKNVRERSNEIKGKQKDFAAFCLTDFIAWRYIHTWFVFSTQLVNCCTHGIRNYILLVYCCLSTVPSL